MTPRSRYRVCAVVLGGLTAAACATKPGAAVGTSGSREIFPPSFRSDVVPVRRVLPESVETVWAALPKAFADLGYPGGPSTQAGERAYLTPSLKVRSRLYQGERNSVYLDCGRTRAGAPAADEYLISFAILARLRPHDGGGTQVEVLVDGSARDPAEKSNPVLCAGTGRLESALLRRLEAQIGVR
jgi:hypothetical protein